jgi:hypothetical protein
MDDSVTCGDGHRVDLAFYTNTIPLDFSGVATPDRGGKR